MSRSWYEKYSDEIEMMNRRAIAINKSAKTIIRKPTPEEIEFYNRKAQLQENYLLKHLKEKLV